jgi:hypothetical protein
MMSTDQVLDPQSPHLKFSDLGITPTPLEKVCGWVAFVLGGVGGLRLGGGSVPCLGCFVYGLWIGGVVSCTIYVWVEVGWSLCFVRCGCGSGAVPVNSEPLLFLHFINPRFPPSFLLHRWCSITSSGTEMAADTSLMQRGTTPRLAGPSEGKENKSAAGASRCRGRVALRWLGRLLAWCMDGYGRMDVEAAAVVGGLVGWLACLVGWGVVVVTTSASAGVGEKEEDGLGRFSSYVMGVGGGGG